MRLLYQNRAFFSTVEAAIRENTSGASAVSPDEVATVFDLPTNIR
jgi:hypothetical protein